jgi:hypothetical protein
VGFGASISKQLCTTSISYWPHWVPVTPNVWVPLLPKPSRTTTSLVDVLTDDTAAPVALRVSSCSTSPEMLRTTTSSQSSSVGSSKRNQSGSVSAHSRVRPSRATASASVSLGSALSRLQASAVKV